ATRSSRRTRGGSGRRAPASSPARATPARAGLSSRLRVPYPDLPAVMMRVFPLLLAAMLGAAQPSPAQHDANLATRAVRRAERSGALTPDGAGEYRDGSARVRPLLKSLPPLRAAELANVLHDVASLWRSYTTPQRALILFTTLAENEDYLTTH